MPIMNLPLEIERMETLHKREPPNVLSERSCNVSLLYWLHHCPILNIFCLTTLQTTYKSQCIFWNLKSVLAYLIVRCQKVIGGCD